MVSIIITNIKPWYAFKYNQLVMFQVLYCNHLDCINDNVCKEINTKIYWKKRQLSYTLLALKYRERESANTDKKKIQLHYFIVHADYY